MSDAAYNGLSLRTETSARSILAEAYLDHRGRGGFDAYSAGSRPAGNVDPNVLNMMQRRGMAVSGLRSRRWGEFPDSPPESSIPHPRSVIESLAICIPSDRAAGDRTLERASPGGGSGRCVHEGASRRGGIHYPGASRRSFTCACQSPTSTGRRCESASERSGSVAMRLRKTLDD